MTKVETDKNGWIISTGEGLTDTDKTYDGDKDIDPINPGKNTEAWHWNGGNPELRETGANIEPEPDEAKRMLLKKAERDWGYSPMQLNRIKRDYPILFDYISAEEYESAKKFLKSMHTEEGVIEYHELQWSLDMLEGRESIELN